MFLTLSPANRDINGVITTLVCVKNAARAAGLKSRPALMSPYKCHIIVVNDRIHDVINSDQR